MLLKRKDIGSCLLVGLLVVAFVDEHPRALHTTELIVGAARNCGQQEDHKSKE